VRLALLLERLDDTLPPPPARLLDAGGDRGRRGPLAERGYAVTILEPSEGMRRVAGERLAATGLDVGIVAGWIEDAPRARRDRSTRSALTRSCCTPTIRSASCGTCARSP
jgi:hypothetical protein